MRRIQISSTFPMWWGYLHVSGTIAAKRFFNHEDIRLVESSPFVERIIKPFTCGTRAAALEYIREALIDE
jgi:hypothetical protein